MKESIRSHTAVGGGIDPKGAASTPRSPCLGARPIPFPRKGFQLQRSDRGGNGARGARATAAATRRRKPSRPIPTRPTAPEEGASAARCDLQQPASVGEGVAAHGRQRLAAEWPDGGHRLGAETIIVQAENGEPTMERGAVPCCLLSVTAATQVEMVVVGDVGDGIEVVVVTAPAITAADIGEAEWPRWPASAMN